MFRFHTTTEEPTKDVHVQLEQDDEDVNILLNGELVAYFDGEDGTLRLVALREGAVPVPTETCTPNGHFRRLKVAGYEIK